jgi:nucleoside-diphosphate-sugar epimerase
MRNVLVTGASSPLGRRLVLSLGGRRGVEHVVGVEPKASSDWIEGVELVAFAPDHRALVEFMNDNAIDTVIHCGLAPDRNGSGDSPADARVIETMRLGAAVAHPDVSVRAWVVASSSAVYPTSSQAPLLHRENGEARNGVGAAAAALLEAEEYVRDVARRAPHQNVSILRLQEIVGPGAVGPFSSLLRQPVLPAPIGYDARVQLLALDDALGALAFAAELELAGVYNVASAGSLRWSEATRALGRPVVPVLPLEVGPFAALARRLRVPHIPEGLLATLRFGHALDTSKLSAAGFEPEHDQLSCLAAFSSRASSASAQRAPRAREARA